MVYNSLERGGKGGERELVMAMGASERYKNTKPPLHNFNLPTFLKWGNQKHLRCMKISDSETTTTTNNRLHHRRSSRSPPSKKIKKGGDDSSSFGKGIAEVSEKLLFNFTTTADKFKGTIFPNDDDDEEEEEEEVEVEVEVPPATTTTNEQEVKPSWNLRTRRPINSMTGKAVKSNNCSPESSKEDKEQPATRPKFAVALSKKEIEDDFIALIGHRPPRRPKKRNRYVQRHLDSLFPGLWLSEVTVDTYKVPDVTDTAKR